MGDIPSLSAPRALLRDPQVRREWEGKLSTWRTVDRRAVHKAAVAEVLITDVAPIDPALSVAAAQWAGGHPTFRPATNGRPHPLLFVETVRQAAIYLAHQEYGVPPGSHFIFERITASFPEAEPWGPSTEPVSVLVAVRTNLHRVGGRVAGAYIESEAWSMNRRIATCQASYRCLGARAYARIRRAGRSTLRAGPTPDIPAPRHRSARRADGPAGESVSTLEFDPHHPTYFDHPVDHLPGMLLLNAAVEAGMRRLRHPAVDRLEQLDMSFDRFAELDRAVSIVSRPAPSSVGGDSLAVAVEQEGAVVAQAALRFTRSTAPRVSRRPGSAR
ncbi:ScbA/BarX family gamma-butyrolactone biosynthesis protein [Blastococcus saxobsidens]|uniref:A-factor biosynthesis hotdog protein n=1 Tax=Blastococcus saxobsidens TaxID=138336 RepID=A0A4Q7Y6I3_9ACTN|nr:ScbA/BarX family gamma-butyrolactone biosynthesis protein [Blastococcus saxobsidens]RZU31545.1 A-factor biosynthesis hotdog protein [Blastococcus saxobsidens]